ncbi:class I SAM-dependent methyltransferase [Devosia sp. ZB163]|uniref:class I SAM-dependent methyltransferase n=1 Tax=Devosia sp. ZB163 TaxID=3025938 RepID=UPI00235E46CB|nr:class I SAM-dependent methyltransferase [Devosia sp. ZB163]MDC9823267.1 class I SAM-dependent methyltransferase [Devosia sp. ZB163]
MTRKGQTFEEAGVVASYVHRPPYPSALLDRLVAIAPAHNALLDIGSGPGKISRALSPVFSSVTAVDPSANMIALGKSLPGAGGNVVWLESLAEDAPLEGRYDLTVAAASIHWMDHVRLFPKLQAHAAADHVFAVVSGDAPLDPPWEKDWQAFLGRWVPFLTGKSLDPARWEREGNAFRIHIVARGDEDFVSDPFVQSVEDFIACQHSRDTFAPSRLGVHSSRFDSELGEMLSPYANGGQLTFRTRSRLTWGSIAA